MSRETGSYCAFTGYSGSSCYSPSYSAFSQEYWERSLFQRLSVMFDFDGFPEPGANQAQIDKDAFKYGLFRNGFLASFTTKRYGVTYQPATPAGIGLQYQPTGLSVSTPYFNFTRPLVIGRETEPIKLTPDYRGVWDIVVKYATELKFNEIAIRLAQINARFAYAIAATDNKTAESVKAIMERLANAEPAIVYNAKLRQMLGTEEGETPWAQFDRDLKKNFILPELLECRRTSLKDFYHEIGIKIMPDKKERMNLDEVSSYDAETFNRRQVWKTCLEESIERSNRLNGTQLRLIIPDEEMIDDGLQRIDCPGQPSAEQPDSKQP